MAQLTIQEQKELRLQAVNMIDEVCGACDLIIENRKELGNKAAYNYCVRECPFGKKLQVIGEKLLEAREGSPSEVEE